jgi:hypothetical protein
LDGRLSEFSSLPDARKETFFLESMNYRSLRFWSPLHGCNAERLSMYDKHGGEFFVIVPMAGSSRQNRMDRNKALEAIADAIDNGEQPGLVTFNG